MKQNKKLTKISRLLSYLLRHKPEKKNLSIDAHGWVHVRELLDNTEITISELQEVVDTDDKKRYEFNDGQVKIRASQGHSIEIDLGYKSTMPPDILYHGTTEKNEKAIRTYGLSKMKRHAVHLSKDKETAKNVGVRHGTPLVLKVDAKRMYQDGFTFQISSNGVWLTEKVPSRYIMN